MKEYIKKIRLDLHVPGDDVKEDKFWWGGWAHAPESDGSINSGLVRDVLGKGSFRQIDLLCEGHANETFFQLASMLKLILDRINDNRYIYLLVWFEWKSWTGV